MAGPGADRGDRHEHGVPGRDPRRAAQRPDRRGSLACGDQGHPDGHPRPAALDQILAADVELAVVWAIKEIVIQLLATRTDAQFDSEWAPLETAVRATDLPEPAALFKTLKTWKTEIRTFCLTRVTNARTEAANLNAKNIKRAGRGYVNHHNYRARILLAATVKSAA